MNKRIVAVFIVMLVLVFGFPIFLAFYKVQVAYYIEKDYERLSQLVFVPVILLLAVLITYKSIQQDIKRNAFKWMDYLKQLPFFVLGMVFLYSIAGSVFSMTLLFLNINLGTPKQYVLCGKIVQKSNHRQKPSEFSYTIVNNKDGKTYIFQTNWKEIKKYKINDRFEKNMKIGFFGFVYAE